MDIFLLCNGLGERFSKDGYFYPKPLIHIHGKPIIFNTLDEIYKSKNDYNVFILYNEFLDNYQFSNLIKSNYSNKNIKFLKLTNTNGPAETLFRGIRNFDIPVSFLSIDCDIIFSYKDVENFFNKPENTVFYFKDENEKPLYSYIKCNDSIVLDIAEKNKISNNACCGIYGFKNPEDYTQAFNTFNLKDKEFYISDVYKYLLDNEAGSVFAKKSEDYRCLGTPILLQNHCLNSKPSKLKRICFDIDNTLFTLPINKDYNNIHPISRNIEFLKDLHKQGHTIILYTARNMRSFCGNIGLINKNAGPQIFNLLIKYNIPYDEIYFGKPYADFYIDDLAVNSFSDIQKNTGFYFNNNESRPHNKIIINEDRVIKETNNDGEIYWYQNIPESIKDLFPEIYSIQNNQIEMEKINGIKFDFLNINKQLKTEHFLMLFEGLKRICDSTSPPENLDIYQNYTKKILKRLNHKYYDEIPNRKIIENEIMTNLKEYESKKLGIIGVSHSDTVFTNIFLCRKDNKEFLKFIDMRGKLDKNTSIFGDVIYDYAKTYQSLVGYDFIFNDVFPNVDYVNRNIKIFEELFVEKFSLEYLSYLRKITASLLYSMLPFHDNSEKRRKYLDLCLKLLYNN